MGEGAGWTRRWVVAAGLVTAAGGAAGLGLWNRNDNSPRGTIVIGSGPPGAVFHPVAEDLAGAVRARAPQVRVEVLVTRASVDNLHRLAAGSVGFGFVSLDSAGDDDGVRSGRVLAVARLYDSLLHLIVLRGSRVRAVTDLQGRRVAIGADGSGTEFTATRLLGMMGVRLGAALQLSQEPAMKALESGAVEAAFTLSGTPTPAVTKTASRRALRLIPLEDSFGALDGVAPGTYTLTSVPERTYSGVEAVATVAVANLLLVRSDAPEWQVRLVITAVLDATSRRFWTHPESQRMDVKMAIATGAVRLHPVVRQWLRDHKP